MRAGHPFCRECLARWQATSHLCPVCRADQRTLDRTGSQGGGQSGGAYEADEAGHLEGPSLATILGLMGQLLAREGAGLSEVYPPAPHEGSGVHFERSSRPTGSSILQQPEPSMATIDELQSSVQFVMARIDSLERRPLYWSSQIAELQEALEALDACRHGTGRNPAQVIQQVQLYTDAVNAQLDEFLTQTEAREQQRRATEGRQQAHASQPSALPSASAPPLPGHTSNAPTSASTCGNTNEASQSSRTWQWGWGPSPAGTTTAEASAPASSSSDTQQTSGIGFGAAAAAAAALAAVGSAAKAAYRRATADSSDTSATDTGRDAAPSSAQRPPTESSGASQRQPPEARAAGAGASDSQAAQPPVQGVYNAVRGIFDQHVSADSSLGRWGEVAHHLTDLHGQMNADDPQRQDVGRLLASAVNAYSAYRRATTSSSSSS